PPPSTPSLHYALPILGDSSAPVNLQFPPDFPPFLHDEAHSSFLDRAPSSARFVRRTKQSRRSARRFPPSAPHGFCHRHGTDRRQDRKSTRLNSSHVKI